MKFLPIASALIVSLILAITAYFFVFSSSFKIPEDAKTTSHHSVAGRLAKFI